MNLANPYRGRSQRKIPIARKSGGSVSSTKQPQGLGTVKDAMRKYLGLGPKK